LGIEHHVWIRAQGSSTPSPLKVRLQPPFDIYIYMTPARDPKKGGIMEEESLRRNLGKGTAEGSLRRSHGGGIIEKESWRGH
jgi:hypothetical protein